MIPDHDHLVKIVRESTKDVFSTMLGIELEEGDAYLDTTAPPAGDGILSFVGLAGTWVGTGSVSCSSTFACKMSSQFLMTEYLSVNEDVLDAVAEVTNMIIGNVKTKLEEDLGPMGLSIPTVIFGRNFASRTVGTFEWSVVPFLTEGERIEIQICLAPQKTSARPRPNLVAQDAHAV
jgi:chemotaxis protein CheX